MTTLVLPVGHYLGSNHRPAGHEGTGELDSHVLRIGWRLHRLDGLEQLAVWALAHGLPEGAGMAPWTSAAVEGAARASGVRDARVVLDELIDLELVVEVDPEEDDAVEFARDARLGALHCGLGELSRGRGDLARDAGDRFGIGAPDGTPAVRVDAFTYELWKWAPACDSLWHVCEVFARADPERPDPARVLARSLPAAQMLIAHGAAYLDEARADWPAEAEVGASPLD